MFVLFSIAVSFIKIFSFRTGKFIKVDAQDTFSLKLTTLAWDLVQVTFQQTNAHLLVIFNAWTGQMLMKLSL